jgi:receptor protein-tyrosine kinase
VNLRDYLLIIRRRKWIGIMVLLVTIGTTATLTTLATPEFEAKATLFVGPQAFRAEDIPGSEAGQIQLSLAIAERLTKTYARMIATNTTAVRAVEEGDLDVPPGYVLSHLTVGALEDTTLIEMRVRDTDPALAQNIANAVAVAFEDLAETLTQPRNDPSAPAAVPVTLFDRALLPNRPVSPNPGRNLALATVLGLVAGVGMMFAAEYLDVAVRGPEDIERLVGLPVLALIPRMAREDVVSRREARQRLKTRG